MPGLMRWDCTRGCCLRGDRLSEKRLWEREAWDDVFPDLDAEYDALFRISEERCR